MKIFLSAAALAIAITVSAQSASEYKYVEFPAKFSDFNNDQYKLASQLKSQLAKKNYTVLNEGDARPENPCNIVTADLKNTSSMFRNKIDVVLRDCNGKEIAVYKGTSMEKEYETGYPDALNRALVSLPVSSGSEQKLAEKTVQVVTETVLTEPTEKVKNIAAETTKAQNSRAEIYTDGTISLSKINLNSNQFILATTGSSSPFATFAQSGKAGVYHVKLENGKNALGYFDQNKIIIETPDNNGNFSRTVLVLK